uniref:hypothetical protein n=1 Tax=Pseudonocardia sp. CA-138482 TaxID=3240023 RepID=UPI003F499010
MALEIYIDEPGDQVLVSWGRGPLTVVERNGTVTEQFAVAGERIWPAVEAEPAPTPRKMGQVKAPPQRRPPVAS